MIISSTEFQQNVGYYMRLADQGEEIIIEKKRPKGYQYKLSPIKIGISEPASKYMNGKKKQLDVLKKIRSRNYRSGWSDSVKFQRWVRDND